MTPVEQMRKEGCKHVSLSDNKRGYQLVKYRLKGDRFDRGTIFQQDHQGWKKTLYDGGRHEAMVTCFYNLTRQ